MFMWSVGAILVPGVYLEHVPIEAITDHSGRLGLCLVVLPPHKGKIP